MKEHVFVSVHASQYSAFQYIRSCIVVSHQSCVPLHSPEFILSFLTIIRMQSGFYSTLRGGKLSDDSVFSSSGLDAYS